MYLPLKRRSGFAAALMPLALVGLSAACGKSSSQEKEQALKPRKPTFENIVTAKETGVEKSLGETGMVAVTADMLAEL